MLFYIKCPTCSRIISENLSDYIADLQAIRKDTKLTRDEKHMKEAALIKKYNYRSICCIQRILGLPEIEFHELIEV